MQNKLISNVIRIGYTGLHVYAIKKLQNKPIMWPNQLIKESTRFSILRRSSILMLDSNNFISSSLNANFRIKYRKFSNIWRRQKIVAPNFSWFLISSRSIPTRPIFNSKPLLKPLYQDFWLG